MYFCCKPCSLEPTSRRRLLRETWIRAFNKPIIIFQVQDREGLFDRITEMWSSYYCCISTSLMKLEVTFIRDLITCEFRSARKTATYINPHTTPSFGRNQETRLTHIDHIRQTRHQLRPGKIMYLQESDVCDRFMSTRNSLTDTCKCAGPSWRIERGKLDLHFWANSKITIAAARFPPSLSCSNNWRCRWWPNWASLSV